VRRTHFLFADLFLRMQVFFHPIDEVDLFFSTRITSIFTCAGLFSLMQVSFHLYSFLFTCMQVSFYVCRSFFMFAALVSCT